MLELCADVTYPKLSVYPVALAYSARSPLPVLYRIDDMDAMHIASEPKTLPSKRSTLWHVGYLDVFAPDCSFRNSDSLDESVWTPCTVAPSLTSWLLKQRWPVQPPSIVATWASNPARQGIARRAGAMFMAKLESWRKRNVRSPIHGDAGKKRMNLGAWLKMTQRLPFTAIATQCYLLWLMMITWYC